MARRRGLFLDFDGTLSEIVARPELAAAEPGVDEALADLARRHEVVAVVSGRPASDLRRLVRAEGVMVTGLYGLPEDGEGRDRIAAAADEVAAAARLVPGAWVEDKGSSLAVHYRQAPDPVGAETMLRPILEEIARRDGLSLFRAKMALEVAAGAVPGKGPVVARLAGERSLDGCLYAGDDLPDLDAFAALDGLADAGVATVKVAVRSEETPPELIAAADLVVERPAGLVALLSGL